MQRIREGASEKSVDIVGEIEADDGPNQQSGHRSQQTTSQFLEVLENAICLPASFSSLGPASRPVMGGFPIVVAISDPCCQSAVSKDEFPVKVMLHPLTLEAL